MPPDPTRQRFSDFYPNGPSPYGNANQHELGLPAPQGPQPPQTGGTGNVGSVPPGGVGATGPIPGLGNLGDALNTAGQVNQFNLDYYHNADQSDPGYSAALALLDPNNAQANFDVSMHGAEGAVAGGIPGSGLAAETTGRLRQSDIERRAALGSNLLTAAHGRTPTPFDVSSQLLTPFQSGQLTLQQAQLALDDRIRTGQLQLSQQDLAMRDRIATGQLTLDQAKLALDDRIRTGQLSQDNARLLLDWYKAQSDTSLRQGELTLQQAQLALQDRIQSGQLQLSQQDLALRDRVQSGQLTLDQARLALQDRIQTGQLSQENARLLLDWYKARQPNFGNLGGGGGHGGGGEPVGGGSPTGGLGDLRRPNNGLPAWPSTGGGGGYAPPPIIAPDNWSSMSPAQQRAYADQYRGNPYNYGQANPLEVDEGNWTDSSPWGDEEAFANDDWYG